MTHRLVLIDDNPDYRVLVRFALAGSDVELVGEAGNAGDGIDLARELQPDLVMVDLVMEPVSGLDAVGPLREAAPDAAVVAVSSYAEHELWGRSLSLPDVVYLSKDLPPSRLAAELLRVLASRLVRTAPIAESRERFPSDLRSARDARRFAGDVLHSWDCSELVDPVSLLVSELVTNAVIHAHSQVELVLRLLPELVRVEVIDAADGGVHRRDANKDAQSGRGMALIEALASSWGIDSLLAGKSVWFEVRRTVVTSG